MEVGKVSYAVCILVCAPPLLLVATLGLHDEAKTGGGVAARNVGSYLIRLNQDMTYEIVQDIVIRCNKISCNGKK